MKVNGEIVPVSAETYARLERCWRQGDLVELSFDMRIQVIHATEIAPDAHPETACHVALQRGPLMLAIIGEPHLCG